MQKTTDRLVALIFALGTLSCGDGAGSEYEGGFRGPASADSGAGASAPAGQGGRVSEAGAGSAGTGPLADAGSGVNRADAGGTPGSSSDAGTPAVSDAEVGREAGSSTGTDAGSNTDAGAAPDAGGMVLIAAPNGMDSAPGTVAQPTTLTAALKRVAAGGAIELRGGTYSSAVQITIESDNRGSADKRKILRPYQSEKPVLDFSSQPYGADGNPRGLQINGHYWHVLGLEVKGSADNGIYVAGSNNVIEGCVTHGNRDTGLQIGRASSMQAMSDWPANNLILNCESYDNYDVAPGSGENADGFAAKLTVGAGNVFRGCVSHHNIDDGWDLYTKTETGPIGAVTLDQCVAHHNGTLTNGTTNANGDRNGFKLGGEKIAVGHVVTRSIAFANGKNGFTWNSNPGAIRMFNNLAFDNAEGNFLFGSSSVSTAAVFANNVSFWTSTASDKSDKTIGMEVSNSNAFWDASKSQPSVNGKGLVVTAADFAAPLTAPTLARNPDGSLNLAPFALAKGSDLENAGVLPSGALPFDAAAYYAGNPDLGAVELR